MKTPIVIPQHIREALDKSPNASPRNTIIVTKLNKNLYSAGWNLQPHGMELNQQWEIPSTEPCKVNTEL